jgi:predicted  nucleic acid-binding Zn-ribbon protein
MVARTSDEAGPGDDEAADRLMTMLRQERDRLVTERDQSRAETEAWRGKAEEARLVAARAEAERDGLRLVIDRLESELDRARMPWWRRLAGA